MRWASPLPSRSRASPSSPLVAPAAPILLTHAVSRLASPSPSHSSPRPLAPQPLPLHLAAHNALRLPSAHVFPPQVLHERLHCRAEERKQRRQQLQDKYRESQAAAQAAAEAEAAEAARRVDDERREKAAQRRAAREAQEMRRQQRAVFEAKLRLAELHATRSLLLHRALRPWRELVRRAHGAAKAATWMRWRAVTLPAWAGWTRLLRRAQVRPGGLSGDGAPTRRGARDVTLCRLAALSGRFRAKIPPPRRPTLTQRHPAPRHARRASAPRWTPSPPSTRSGCAAAPRCDACCTRWGWARRVPPP